MKKHPLALLAVATAASALIANFILIHGASAASMLSLGPRGIESLIAGQLFNKGGRWYLIDDGGICYAYLQSPHTRLEGDRLVMNARLTSRLGQRVGDACVGANFASNVTLSGKLRATDRKLVLDDIRIDHVEDEATRSALTLALQIAPQAMPRTASIDVVDLLQRQVVSSGGLPVRIERLHILGLATQSDAVSIQVDMNLSTP